jgi:hypothetical protein
MEVVVAALGQVVQVVIVAMVELVIFHLILELLDQEEVLQVVVDLLLLVTKAEVVLVYMVQDPVAFIQGEVEVMVLLLLD